MIIISSIFTSKLIKIVIGGPYHSGKTTTIHKLDPRARSADKLQPDGQTTTVGFDLGKVVWVTSSDGQEEIIAYGDYENNKEKYENANVREIGLFGAAGQMRFSAVRKATLRGAKGILFVIDSSISGHIGHAVALYEEIRLILGDDVPLIVLANKQDIADAKSPEEISELLNMNGVQVLPSSSINEEGIREALLELLNSLEL